MKTIKILLMICLVILVSSCGGSDDAPAATPTGSGVFNATIGTETFSTNNTMLAKVSAGGTQGFIATGTNGKSFSSAIFPTQFAIGQAVNIAYSSSITYTAGGVTYIPKSGTMTLTVMENFKKMKGSFTGVFTGGTPITDINISGSFDLVNP